MSVLGLDLGYSVKYNPLPEGVPVYPLSRHNTDTEYHSKRLNTEI